MTSDWDIVIIGAGAAGIGAARRLASSGLKVVIVEALDRVGGRAWTETAAGLPLDLGCGWLHSAERNPWVPIAEELGFTVDRTPAAWRSQFRDLGFPPDDRADARKSFEAWSERIIESPPDSDIAADALEPGGRWTAYLQAISGYISGDELERISARDYAAYDAASSDENWRILEGYGALIAAGRPPGIDIRLATPITSVALDGRGVRLATPAGDVSARVGIVTVSTNVLAGDTIAWGTALDPWRHAASQLPLGANEKLFLDIIGASPFEPDSHVLGDPHDATTGTYSIRPLGRNVIECFLGGAGAHAMAKDGQAASYDRAIGQIVRLFGSDVRRNLKPLIASDWTRTPSIGGAYSHALPGQSDARLRLAQPFEDRLFFAGEATHVTDFSTAHGAYQSGIRAADEVMAVLAAAAR